MGLLKAALEHDSPAHRGRKRNGVLELVGRHKRKIKLPSLLGYSVKEFYPLNRAGRNREVVDFYEASLLHNLQNIRVCAGSLEGFEART